MFKEKPKETVEARWISLADKLEELNSNYAEGKGYSFVRYVILHLRSGNIKAAKNACHTEIDKFRGVPEIKKLITQKPFEPGENYPWKISDEFERKKQERLKQEK